MMNHQDAIEFAAASAREAFDQSAAYGGLQNAIDSYRENVRDTLNDERASDHEADAFAVFDTEVAKLSARL